MATRWEDDSPLPPSRDERGVMSLFADLAREASTLIHQEIALAQAQMAARISDIGSAAAVLIAGGFVVYAGFLALIVSAILGLDHFLVPWLSALIVGSAIVLLGIALLWIGRRSLHPARRLPERTLKTLRDDAQWARGQMQ